MATHILTRRWAGPETLDEACTRRHVVRAGDGLALRRGVTRADEAGRCNTRDRERVAGQRQARKVLVLDGPVAAESAQLCVYVTREEEPRDAQREGPQDAEEGPREDSLEVVVNGRVTAVPWAAPRPYWEDAWRRVPIDPAWLRPGSNEFVLRATGGSSWNLLVEESVQPDRSAVSDDGGVTWRSDELGVNDRADGEYLVRLWLDQHAREGWIASEAVDLLDADGVARGGPAAAVTVTLEGEEPAGTTRRLQWRAGATPAYDPSTWSAWTDVTGAIDPGASRWLQWRVLLRTDDPAVTPTVTAATLTAEVADGLAPTVRVEARDNRPLVYGSHRFSHLDAAEPRGRILRERWHLDQVVGPAKREFEALVRLRQWVRQQWEDGWNMGPLDYVPPWDAAVILELASRQLALGMCTHYATVFTHCCAVLGFTARTQVMRGHCITEVWSNDYGKWVTMDAGGDADDATKYTYHFERDGVPLSALEAHTAYVEEDLEGIELSPPPPAAAAERFTVAARIRLWSRFMFDRRNDELATLGPGEPEHGKGAYHYDGYLFWQDHKTPPLPWFTRHTDRVGDLYWDVDRVRIHLQEAGAGRLRVDLEDCCPNRERYEARLDGGGWEARPATFDLALTAGEHLLEARTVNARGRAGAVSVVGLRVWGAARISGGPSPDKGE